MEVQPLNYSKFAPNAFRTCIVKVGSYENKNAVGVLSNPNLELDLQFNSSTQLLLAMDELLDAISMPQRAMSPRSFEPRDCGAGICDPVHADQHQKPIAIFKIDVIFRQNASWQGNVVWLDTKEEAQFRSVLELLIIIDSAIEKKSIGQLG